MQQIECGSLACLVVEPEEGNQYYGKTNDHPVCQADQPAEMAQRRAEVTIAQDVMVAMAGHAFALNHHPLYFAPGVLLIADVALASGAAKRIKIVRDQI